MVEQLPLLVFPQPRKIEPAGGKPTPPGPFHFPSHERQKERLKGQLTELESDFSWYKATVSGALAEFEPESVLIVEVAESMEDFRQAVENTEGLEWQGEWEMKDLKPDEDFYTPPKIGVLFFKQWIPEITDKEQSAEIRNILMEQEFIDKNGVLIVEEFSDLVLPDHLEHFSQKIEQAIVKAKQKPFTGKLFVSLGNQRGFNEILSLWKRWEKGEELPHGKKQWKKIFDHAIRIRPWGIEETLYETGMIDRWRDLIDPILPSESSSTRRIS